MLKSYATRTGKLADCPEDYREEWASWQLAYDEGTMRMSLIIASFVLCLIGMQFLLVDKIVLYEGVFPPADPEAQFYEMDDTKQRHIDLPDSGGYALIAAAVICLLFSIGLKRGRDKS